MKTLEAIHHNHIELTSNILFLKKEIVFLLKILKNCYSASVESEKIKLMDAYWKGFANNNEQLEQLQKRIQLEEKKNAVHYKNNPTDSLLTDTKELEFDHRMHAIQQEVQLLKESFYEFMQGCNACALKTH